MDRTLTFACPYYRCESSLKLTCELCSFKFKDKTERRDLVYTYCGHPTNYNNCMLKKIRDNYYERKFKDGDN